MNLPTITNKLPEGYVLCEHILQLYKLKPRKRKWTNENIERNNGQFIYVYSEKENLYYRKLLLHFISDEEYNTYLRRQILYYKP